MAAGLMLAVFSSSLKQIDFGPEPWFALFFLVAMLIGLSGAPQNGETQILRDLVAHCFLGVGVLLGRSMSGRTIDWLLCWIAILGGIIALRFLIIAGFSLQAVGEETRFTFDQFLKLNTDPFVTFSAAYGWCALLDRRQVAWWRGALFLAGVVSTAAISVSALRAPMAIVAVVVVVAIWRALAESRPVYRVFLLAVLSLIFLPMVPLIEIAITNFSEKMVYAGSSEKFREMLYVFKDSASRFPEVLTGDGFGAMIDVGGRELPFTHSIFSYYLAKSGFLPVVILAIYLVSISFRALLRGLLANPVDLCIYLILLYGFFLNPHYKYLTFGVLISLFHYRLQAISRSVAPLRPATGGGDNAR
ncbi:hypothetical protein [Lentisalinibacter sediminis]|uniref:hypothetical protein n=1 Tax=Lentisalinibacter sediminis TaxID=2992237 RepID=UPI00386DE465